MCVFSQRLHAYWERLHLVHKKGQRTDLPFPVKDFPRRGGTGWGQSQLCLIFNSCELGCCWWDAYGYPFLFDFWSFSSISKLAYVRVLILSVQVIVPLPSWDLKTKEPLTSDPEKYAIETELIFKYSPFKNEQQLMEQFNKIESSSGKHVMVCLHVFYVQSHYFKAFVDLTYNISL